MSKKNLDFEVNLLPIISLLAVCISFLLLTAVWDPKASLTVSQSVGAEGTISPEESYSLWIQFEDNAKITVFLKNASLENIGQTKNFRSTEDKESVNIVQYIETMLKKYPSIKNAIIAPMTNTTFNQLIGILDQLKKIKTLDVGIAPL